MRIISKFKDYYDSAAAFGTDSNIVYVRQEREIRPIKLMHSHNRTLLHTRKDLYLHKRGVVGFCGKFYAFVEVTRLEDYSPVSTRIFWSFDEFDQWFESINPDWKWYTGRWSGKRKHPTHWNTVFSHHFECEGYKEEVFHKYQVPIVCYWQPEGLILNPRLQDLEFYRVFDPYQAHQEIAMFVGGVLNSPENRMIEIGDDDKIAKHGYDENSFRKLRGEGPNRKRK